MTTMQPLTTKKIKGYLPSAKEVARIGGTLLLEVQGNELLKLDHAPFQRDTERHADKLEKTKLVLDQQV